MGSRDFCRALGKGPGTCDAVEQKPERPHPDALVEPDVLGTTSLGFRLSSVDDGGHEVGAEHVVRHERGPAKQVREEEPLKDGRRTQDLSERLEYDGQHLRVEMKKQTQKNGSLGQRV